MVKNQWRDDFDEVRFRCGFDGDTVMFAQLLTGVDLNYREEFLCALGKLCVFSMRELLYGLYSTKQGRGGCGALRIFGICPWVRRWPPSSRSGTRLWHKK